MVNCPAAASGIIDEVAADVADFDNIGVAVSGSQIVGAVDNGAAAVADKIARDIADDGGTVKAKVVNGAAFIIDEVTGNVADGSFVEDRAALSDSRLMTARSVDDDLNAVADKIRVDFVNRAAVVNCPALQKIIFVAVVAFCYLRGNAVVFEHLVNDGAAVAGVIEGAAAGLFGQVGRVGSLIFFAFVRNNCKVLRLIVGKLIIFHIFVGQFQRNNIIIVFFIFSDLLPVDMVETFKTGEFEVKFVICRFRFAVCSESLQRKVMIIGASLFISQITAFE